ncbi:uroporphyrinogen-III C-methyltransferase [Alicyclobacillus sp. ALC3]|uniref:uroporphyrinogen-III C-methyltransferase n=1 Tax=Alicyclobacillus sp. ALC3 TaxID=2796143 RepID=UPI002379EB62|nr:uroporphyrinogen-III C-methyltransferase [Alicyclobacillus sp. ALC3]WDL98742.1 uroporphyrinogen-III C-methyltransferase [Alicyclobacillus sp. ALC3]
MTGRVYLVGAGPGDAGLLTTRGRRLLSAADAVVYDRLISPRLLDFVPRQAEQVYVGKSPGRHALTQEAIQELLVDLAGRHETVVRLKGGDPFVFGRGGEEAQWMGRHGVTFEVVPGVTSAVSVPAYAGIPLTARGISCGFAVVTGQSGDLTVPDVTACVDLLRLGGTLVVLMGMGRLREIAAVLTASGVSVDLPAAAVQWGTRAMQRSVHATLGTLACEVESAGLGAPAVIVIGETALMHADIAWVTERSLHGKRVVLAVETEHEATQAGELLESLGAEFVTFSSEREAMVNDGAVAADVSLVMGEHGVMAAEVGLAAKLSRASGQSSATSETSETSERRLSFATALDAALFFRRWAETGADVRRLAGVTLAATPTAAKVLLSLGLIPDAALSDSADTSAYAEGFTLPRHVAEVLSTGDVDAVWVTSEIAWNSLTRAASNLGCSLPSKVDLCAALCWHGVSEMLGANQTRPGYGLSPVAVGGRA